MAARGNKILVKAPRGECLWEGFINTGETPFPGTIMQLDPTQAMVGGRFVWKIYDADADGGRPKGPFIVLLDDQYQGRTLTTAYAAGEKCFGYVPLPGDELNLLIEDVTTGTGATDDHAAGEILIVNDTTGTMIATTGTPETEVAMLLAAVNDVAGDTLGWCVWTGY